MTATVKGKKISERAKPSRLFYLFTMFRHANLRRFSSSGIRVFSGGMCYRISSPSRAAKSFLLRGGALYCQSPISSRIRATVL